MSSNARQRRSLDWCFSGRYRTGPGLAKLGLWALLAVVAALSTGCGMLAQQTEAPRPSASITSFVRQPRPGEGLIGP